MAEKLPESERAELDPATAEAIDRGILVKFAPPEFYEQGRPKDAGEFHTAVLCREPGDTLTFDVTPHIPGKDPSWLGLGQGNIGAAWVVTHSGNKYGIGNGYVYNHKLGSVFALDPNVGQMQLRVGQEAYIPGAGDTSAIKSVLISSEINYANDDYSWTGKNAVDARVVNALDPLMDVRAIGDAIDRGGDPIAAVNVVRDDASWPGGTASFV